MSTKLLDKKIEYWEHQLLDLGKRNKMINYRESKRTTLKIVEPSFVELFNRIALNEETLTFQRSVDRETDIRVFSILSLLENLSVALPVTIGDIKTEGSVLERQKTLKNLRSKARLSLEEQGTNILYLSFGFIEWRDGKGASAQWIKSPLILVPVVLSLDALNSPYTLKKHEDDIVLNPTLEYYLKTEYGIELPQFETDKDNLEDYLKSLEEIADQRGWRILKEVSLGLLSFLKISMYNDLLRNEERIKKNPVIKALAGDAKEANEIPEYLQEFKLDSINPQDCYQVMSADSSQQDAILYSKNNISFVMQGPPGTGKSQTITNIIAEALADGKKVLFVSEKMAALQVVYRRLQEAHLGDFCLPLHSYKANKKEILEQIGANLKLKQTKVKDVAISNLEELLSIRQDLNKYAEELHSLNPELNISCYEVYSKLEKVNNAPSVSFTMDNPLEVSQSRLQAYVNAIKEYSLSLERLDYYIEDNPWEGLSSRTLGYEYNEKMKMELKAFMVSLNALIGVLETIPEINNLPSKITYDELSEVSELIETLCDLPQIPRNWVEEYDFEGSINFAKETKANCEKMRSICNNVRKIFSDEIYEFDYNEWKDRLIIEINNISSLPLLKNKRVDCYVKESERLSLAFKDLLKTLKEADDSYNKINNILGTSYSTNACIYQQLNALIELLKENIILNKNWFSDDIAKIKCLVSDAQSISKEILQMREKILKDWETEILSLDFNPILLRYKTEYTNIFKIFKGQYKRDKKQILALNRMVIKKVDDNVVIELLTTLKEYHEKIKWFDDKSDKLKNVLGTYFIGIETNWLEVLNAIDTTEKIYNLFEKHVPEELIDILSVEHKDLSIKLENLLNIITTNFKKSDLLMNELDIKLSVTSKEFEYAKTVGVLEEYISKFNIISNHFEVLKPFLKRLDEQIDNILQTFEDINLYKNIKMKFMSSEKRYKDLYGEIFLGEQTDWNNLISLLYRVSEVKNKKHYKMFTPIINSTDSRKQELKIIAEQLNINCNKNSFIWISQQFDSNVALQKMTIVNLKDKINVCLLNIDYLEKWIDYQEAKEKCITVGLEDFLEKIEDGYIKEDIEKIFLKGFYHMWISAVCDKSAEIRRFRRNTHDEKIKKFIELDDLQLLIAQMRIREKLIESLPSTHNMLKATDEVAILNKELNKKRKIMPLRKLFRMIPNLLMKLKPCLMMSPLSVSYFLETEAYHFDLVIFDEASQIFPEDAIGAIFRGSQVIIAGDSKQLPPTNFFSATTNNFDADYDIKDEEDFSELVSDSILEEAASVLPNRTLLWHYRSKHENLIAFSNREIYKNNLITFPNSINNIPDMGVEYIYVEDGCYDRGGKKNNIREAEECVRLVFEHIRKHPNRSLGIIAFSESQQATIENAIIDYRERNPKYEWFFDESKEEPFFIKNLENVQGDERDTIIFSICYGKDKKGNMYMNFGPVGHSGGERRLNVAITRAKCNIKLVGSILPSDIDINRAKSEGARMLRSYIEYARKGTFSLRSVDHTEAFEAEDDFCEIIAQFLEKHNYEVERQVGCSDYKIDIAVVNPNAEGEFIAGIECDGLSYIQAKTARDRDHLRRSVLQNMGWNLYRIWSTEWIRNPIAEGEALLAFLKSVYDKNGKVMHDMKQSNEEEVNITIDSIATETVKSAKNQSPNNPYGFQYYKEANWWETNHSGLNDNYTRISENILHIVSVEQPIHLEMLYKRMGPSFTTGKATNAVKRTIDDVIQAKLQNKVVIDNEQFVRLLPLEMIIPRIPKEYETPRPIEYIHTEEVAMAMKRIIEYSFGITEEDLASECARAFGFERKGPKIKSKTDAAIQYLVDNQIIRIIDDKAQLIGENK